MNTHGMREKSGTGVYQFIGAGPKLAFNNSYLGLNVYAHLNKANSPALEDIVVWHRSVTISMSRRRSNDARPLRAVLSTRLGCLRLTRKSGHKPTLNVNLELIRLKAARSSWKDNNCDIKEQERTRGAASSSPNEKQPTL